VIDGYLIIVKKKQVNIVLGTATCDQTDPEFPTGSTIVLWLARPVQMAVLGRS